MEELKLRIYELTYKYGKDEISMRKLTDEIYQLFDEFRSKEINDKLDEIIHKLK